MENSSTYNVRIINTKEVERKLKNLEMRALKTEKEFDKLILRAADLLETTERCACQVELNRKTVTVMELFISKDIRVQALLQHVSLFFAVLLKKVQGLVEDALTVKDLWKFPEDSAVSVAVNSIVERLGFSKSEQGALKIIFDVMLDLNLLGRGGNVFVGGALCRRPDDDFAPITSQSGGDTEITSLILYLNRQNSEDLAITSALCRMVVAAYWSLVGERLPDVASSPFDKAKLENYTETKVHVTRSETLPTSANEGSKKKQMHSKSQGNILARKVTNVEGVTKEKHNDAIQNGDCVIQTSYGSREDTTSRNTTDNDVSIDRDDRIKTNDDIKEEEFTRTTSDNFTDVTSLAMIRDFYALIDTGYTDNEETDINGDASDTNKTCDDVTKDNVGNN